MEHFVNITERDIGGVEEIVEEELQFVNFNV